MSHGSNRTTLTSDPHHLRHRNHTRPSYFLNLLEMALISANFSLPPSLPPPCFSVHTHLQDILYLHVPVLRKNVHCVSPGRRG